MAPTSVDLTGKVCLITGASSGIGTPTALAIARMGARMVLLCRDPKKGEAAVGMIKARTKNDEVRLIVCNLASQKSIRNAVQEFKTNYDALHVLVNNAGLMMWKRETTKDGIEMQFGVNHLGPFLLTNLLLDVLKASAPSRIVNVASTVHSNGKINFDDIQSEKKYWGFGAYCQSKLANVLFTYELARKLDGTGVTANCLHPGVVRTRIMRDLNPVFRGIAKVGGLFMTSPDSGALTSVHVATSPELEGVSGKYFDKEAEAASSSDSRDEDLARRLWDLSEEMTGLNQ